MHTTTILRQVYSCATSVEVSITSSVTYVLFITQQQHHTLSFYRFRVPESIRLLCCGCGCGCGCGCFVVVLWLFCIYIYIYIYTASVATFRSIPPFALYLLHTTSVSLSQNFYFSFTTSVSFISFRFISWNCLFRSVATQSNRNATTTTTTRGIEAIGGSIGAPATATKPKPKPTTMKNNETKRKNE